MPVNPATAGAEPGELTAASAIEARITELTQKVDNLKDSTEETATAAAKTAVEGIQSQVGALTGQISELQLSPVRPQQRPPQAPTGEGGRAESSKVDMKIYEHSAPQVPISQAGDIQREMGITEGTLDRPTTVRGVLQIAATATTGLATAVNHRLKELHQRIQTTELHVHGLNIRMHWLTLDPYRAGLQRSSWWLGSGHRS